MINDDLIRQVATEIRQHHHRGTMEEALDAAKAVIPMVWNHDAYQRKYFIMEGQYASLQVMLRALSDWPHGGFGIEDIINTLMGMKVNNEALETGEDYQLLSTAPQIVEEIIDPEERNAPTTETQEGTGTPAGQ